MIVLVAAILSTQATLPLSAPDPDIVVIGKRLAAWRGTASRTFGITSCKTTLSTGDKEIDEVGCMALKKCWSTYRPNLVAARKLKDNRESGAESQVQTAMGQCLKSTRDDLIARLVSRRRGRSS